VGISGHAKPRYLGAPRVECGSLLVLIGIALIDPRERPRRRRGVIEHPLDNVPIEAKTGAGEALAGQPAAASAAAGAFKPGPAATACASRRASQSSTA
jgi:hypothetical protein